MRHRSHLFALLAALALVIAIPAAASGSEDERPFQLATDESRTTEVPVACPASAPAGSFCLHFEGVGEGNASHMGSIALVRSHTVVITPDGVVNVTQGSWMATAADGDRIWGAYGGTLSGAPPVLSIQSWFTITGGDGRFDGASGSGTQSGTFDVVTGTGQVSAKGTIGY
jgi:hypothetical protein